MVSRLTRRYSRFGLTILGVASILKSVLEHQNAVDRVFHALGDPVRRGMLDRLSRGPASVSELAEPLDITLAAVVQHVQILEKSGVIRTQKEGRVRTCRLEPRGFDTAERWLAQRRTLWERRLDRLGAFLDRLPPPDAGEPKNTKKAKKKS